MLFHQKNQTVFSECNEKNDIFGGSAHVYIYSLINNECFYCKCDGKLCYYVNIKMVLTRELYFPLDTSRTTSHSVGGLNCGEVWGCINRSVNCSPGTSGGVKHDADVKAVSVITTMLANRVVQVEGRCSRRHFVRGNVHERRVVKFWVLDLVEYGTQN